MSAEVELVMSVLPRFEAAVYDGLALKRIYGGRRLSPEALESQRRMIATATYCQETSTNGLYFLKDTVGIDPVRMEWHEAQKQNGPEEHCFLSLASGELDELSDDDIVIDPTYLQYSNTRRALSNRPKVFVGTRASIIDVMRDPEFTSASHAPLMHALDTLVHIEV